MEIPRPENRPDENAEEPVWTYRGYRIRSGEFVTAMVHFFRGEVQRANVWRTRLDATTNWAVVVTGATLSIAFSQPDIHHGVLLLNSMLVTLFLYIEARRYRYYELWSSRVRLMETDFYAAMLVPPFHPAPDWAENLAESLLHPSFPISVWEAVGRRLRRNYLWLFLIIGFAWAARQWLYPEPPADLSEFISRAAAGTIAGNIVIAAYLGYLALLVFIAVVTASMMRASGEVLPRFNFGGAGGQLTEALRSGLGRAWYRPKKPRRQYLAYIVTDKPDEVSGSILEDMNRGVTALPAKGMYTGKDHSVLMCALTLTEINQLKASVVKQDPRAFVIISAAAEILGSGFSPLEGN
jgi:uncharacterized membrane protein